MVLLDGSGLIFREEFLQQGEKGGRDAATQLSEALQRYVAKNFPGIASLKIMTKIYINTKALSDMCIRGGVLNELSLIGDFVRAFNETIPLFEIVEMGPEKDNACYKIEGMFSFIIDIVRLALFSLSNHLSTISVIFVELPSPLPTFFVVQMLIH